MTGNATPRDRLRTTEFHEEDLGLAHDLPRLDRRNVLRLAAGAGAFLLAACSDKASTSSAGSTTTPGGPVGPAGSTTTPAAGSVASSASGAVPARIPEETAGPYPADGSNGPNVLDQSGIVRRDIRSSFGSASGTAAGTPLEIVFTVLDSAAGGRPLEGAALYAWHCDPDGRYSIYSQGATDKNWLRGVQAAGTDGRVSFTSVFPGCYPGRWPHIHFEVYPSVAAAASASNRLTTSQIALPEAGCRAVYATTGYATSNRNLEGVSLASDMVFRDGWAEELGTMSGTPGAALTVALTVAV